MASRHHKQKNTSTRLLPVLGLLAITAVFLFAIKPDGVEYWFYDSFQRYQYTPPSEDVVLVTVDSTQNNQRDIWGDRQFGELLRSINKQNPRLIIATQPLALPAVPGEEQLRALTKLQKTAARSESLSNANETLSRQLEGFQRLYAERENLAEQLAAKDNVILATLPSDFPIENNRAANCASHAINLNAIDTATFRKVSRSRYLAIPPARICNSIAGVGFNKFWADPDGVIRRASLILQSEGVYLPSLALSALAHDAGQSNSGIVAASDSALTLDDTIINTGSGFRILNRYYGGSINESAFSIIPASSLLNGSAEPLALENKIVLIGEPEQMSDSILSTPVTENMSPLTLVATNLSNLLDGSYLLRPAWLSTAETIGLLAAVALLALILPRSISSPHFC